MRQPLQMSGHRGRYPSHRLNSVPGVKSKERSAAEDFKKKG